MVTTVYKFPSNQQSFFDRLFSRSNPAFHPDWNDGGRWSQGVPQPGDTAVIQSGRVYFEDLGLYGIQLRLGGAGSPSSDNGSIRGNVLSITHSSIVNPEFSAGGVLTKDLIVGDDSFIGVGPGHLSAALGVASDHIASYGTLAAERSGGRWSRAPLPARIFS
jgi:hypothetical protein